jgi:hypothetical protein
MAVVSRPTVRRAPISAWLVEQLSVKWLVGYAEFPEKAGWLGQPDKAGSTFRPWITLVGGPASMIDGSLAYSESEWQLPYVFTAYGQTSVQCESLADEMRLAVANLPEHTFATPEGRWKLHHIRLLAVGAVIRYESGSSSNHYAQTDTFTCYVSKEES